MRHQKLTSIIVIIAAFAVAMAILIGFNPLAAIRQVSQKKNAPASGGNVAAMEANGYLQPVVPSGDQVYQVAEAAEVMPKIVQVEVDPPDVHVGDVQHFSIVLQDDAAILSVDAVTRTDNETTTLPLQFVGPTSPTSLLPQRYFVDGNHQLAFATPGDANVAKSAGFGSAALAAAPPQYTYAGQWTVKDTHETKYYTTFLVRDAIGRTNSIVMAWLDPCGFGVGGNVTLGGSCTMSGSIVDGVDNGNLTIGANTLTISNPAVLVWNSGFSITLGGSSQIAISSGASIQKSYLWMVDADTDGYPANTTQYAGSSNPVGNGRRRYLLTSATTTDCYDTNGNAKPGQTAYFTTSRGDGSFDYNCDSAQTSDLSPTLYWGTCTITTAHVICQATPPGTCVAAGCTWIPNPPDAVYGTPPSCGNSGTPLFTSPCQITASCQLSGCPAPENFSCATQSATTSACN